MFSSIQTAYNSEMWIQTQCKQSTQLNLLKPCGSLSLVTDLISVGQQIWQNQKNMSVNIK